MEEWALETPLMKLYKGLIEKNRDREILDERCPNCSTKALEPIDNFRERMYKHVEYQCIRCGYTA